MFDLIYYSRLAIYQRVEARARAIHGDKVSSLTRLTGFCINLKMEGVVQEITVHLEGRKRIQLTVPKDLIKDQIGPDPKRADCLIWRTGSYAIRVLDRDLNNHCKCFLSVKFDAKQEALLDHMLYIACELADEYQEDTESSSEHSVVSVSDGDHEIIVVEDE